MAVKTVTFTLQEETVNKLDEYAKKKSISKSALIDRLINEEMIKDALDENHGIDRAEFEKMKQDIASCLDEVRKNMTIQLDGEMMKILVEEETKEKKKKKHEDK